MRPTVLWPGSGVQTQGLTEAAAAWFVGVSWFRGHYFGGTLEHAAVLVSITKCPWGPVPKLTLSMKFGVSYFRLCEIAIRQKLIALWQSYELSHRWTDEYLRLAACLCFPVLQGINYTEINALTSCSVEGNKIKRYY